MYTTRKINKWSVNKFTWHWHFPHDLVCGATAVTFIRWVQDGIWLFAVSIVPSWKVVWLSLDVRSTYYHSWTPWIKLDLPHVDIFDPCKKKVIDIQPSNFVCGYVCQFSKGNRTFLKAELSRYSQTMQFSQLIQQGGFLADEEMYCLRPFWVLASINMLPLKKNLLLTFPKKHATRNCLPQRKWRGNLFFRSR